MKPKQTESNAAALRELSGHMARISDPDTLLQLLDEVLTVSERRDLALRWRLLVLLRQGMPQRRIATELGISLCKITRGSGVLKKPGSLCAALIPGAETKSRKAT